MNAHYLRWRCFLAYRPTVDPMTATTRFPLPALLTLTLLLTACGDDVSPGEVPPARPTTLDAGRAPVRVGTPAPTLPVEAAKEVQRITYRCSSGRTLVLRLYDDQRTRLEIDHETHVLRPVPVEGGTLFLGDSINVKVNGDRLTASRNGIVLMTNCRAQLDP